MQGETVKSVTVVFEFWSKWIVKHGVVNPLKKIMTVRARLLEAPKFCIFLKSLFLFLS